MSAPAQSDVPSSRFYDMDALRAFAMSLGVVLHTCLFLTVGTGWPVLDAAADEADQVYGTINAVIHGFRMPLFFMVSGFFSALLWQRRGLRALAVQRLKRVGVPLALGCLTIIPAIALIVIAAGLVEEDIPLFILPFIGLFDMAHLWFLWYLLLMAAGFLVLVKMGLQFRHPVIWWLAIPVTCGFMLLMDQRAFGADSIFGVYIPVIESELSLLPNPIVLGYYFSYFLFGAFLYRRGFVVQSWWAAAIIPAVPAYYFGSHFLAAGYDGSGPLISAPFQTAFAWLLCFGMLGLFRWMAARESTWDHLLFRCVLLDVPCSRPPS